MIGVLVSSPVLSKPDTNRAMRLQSSNVTNWKSVTIDFSTVPKYTWTSWFGFSRTKFVVMMENTQIIMPNNTVIQTTVFTDSSNPEASMKSCGNIRNNRTMRRMRKMRTTRNIVSNCPIEPRVPSGRKNFNTHWSRTPKRTTEKSKRF